VCDQRQWLMILEEAKRKKMALDNQRKETSLQHESVTAVTDTGNTYTHTYTHTYTYNTSL